MCIYSAYNVLSQAVNKDDADRHDYLMLEIKAAFNCPLFMRDHHSMLCLFVLAEYNSGRPS